MKLYPLNVILEDDQGVEFLVANKVFIATQTRDKSQGLIGFDALPFNYALLMYPAKAIHMRGVQFPIDVVYMDQQMQVVRMIQHIPPGAVDYGHKSAYYVLELPDGTLRFNPVKMRITTD